MEIYYFSGTGNSLATARMINEQTTEKSKIISIPSVGGKAVIKSDRVGFVFPVFCHKVPDIVKQFIIKMEFLSSPYIYAVATHGGEPGQSLFDIKALLENKGQSLSLGIAIAMPGNAIETNPDDESKLLSTLEQKAKKIARLVDIKKTGVIDGKKGLMESIRNQIIGFISWNYLFSPKRYKTTDNCTGCGTCGKICPKNNIRLVNYKPEWQKECVACLACFHWCPKEAIYMDNFIIKKEENTAIPI